MGACIRSPKIYSRNMISFIFCEAVGIYGVILAIVLLVQRYHWFEVETDEGFESAPWAVVVSAGYGVFAAGITVGLCNIASG